MKKEHQRIQQQMDDLQKKLDNYPEGKLICCHQGKYSKWYQKNGHNKIYIPKENKSFAELLAEKKYISSQFEDLAHEKMALEFYLKHHIPQEKKSNVLLTENSNYKELLTPYFKPKQEELFDWANSEYESNPYYPEYLTHKTTKGHYVRSKSEAMIAHILYTNQIPYRYECALYLNDSVYYPDFTIRHPHTGEIIYWEHFGKMDDASYIQKTYTKLQTYTEFGLLPDIHVITTFETSEHPLSIEKIQRIVKEYFL